MLGCLSVYCWPAEARNLLAPLPFGASEAWEQWKDGTGSSTRSSLSLGQKNELQRQERKMARSTENIYHCLKPAWTSSSQRTSLPKLWFIRKKVITQLYHVLYFQMKNQNVGQWGWQSFNFYVFISFLQVCWWWRGGAVCTCWLLAKWLSYLLSFISFLKSWWGEESTVFNYNLQHLGTWFPTTFLLIALCYI